MNPCLIISNDYSNILIFTDVKTCVTLSTIFVNKMLSNQAILVNRLNISTCWAIEMMKMMTLSGSSMKMFTKMQPGVRQRF